MKYLVFQVAILFFLIPSWVVGQKSVERTIEWQNPVVAEITSVSYSLLSFKGADYSDDGTKLPLFAESIALDQNASEVTASFSKTQFETLSTSESKGVVLPNDLPAEIKISTTVQVQRKQPYLNYSFVPLRKNPQTGAIEKLVSFELNYQVSRNKKAPAVIHQYAQNSVLKSGKWVKIKIQDDGIYRLTAGELKNMGFDNPMQVKMFGNNESMLPLRNAEESYDDLSEMAILRTAESIVFYAKGPTRWYYSTAYSMFRQLLHTYSDFSYYFLTDEVGSGKSPAQLNSISGTAMHTVTSFDDYLFHEKEDTNLIKSGRTWYGEEFGILDEIDFSFSFPNIETSSPVKLFASAIARATVASSYYIYENGNQVSSIENITKIYINPDYSYAFGASSYNEFFAGSANITLKVRYEKPYSSAKGWLDYLTLNARRKLKLEGGMMPFRDMASSGAGQSAKFVLSGAGTGASIWDVSDLLNVKNIAASASGEDLSFTVATDDLHEFIAFDGTQYLSILGSEEVPNQDIHGSGQPDMIIVTPEIFLPYAEELAEIHRETDNMEVLVVLNQAIYNEFSSGMPDVSGIRNMARMFYENANTADELPGYMLFFGDGSYDNKSNKTGNSNYILTYQTPNALHPISSFVTDDFFGFLDPTESPDTGTVDIALGRLPVSSISQAQMALGKIRSYTSPETFGDWRNILCFIGDDSDNENTVQHMAEAEEVCVDLASKYPNLNYDKIYLDAYPQVYTASGERYPDAKLAIKNRVENGALIVSYTGHGNELGLTHEQVIVVSDILNWGNYEKLPLFMTSTCEFSRFDDYGRTSGGELIFLNPKGGGIGLVTTTRPVYPSTMDNNFYKNVFEKNSQGEYYRMGDLLMRAKNQSASQSNPNKKKFILLGDPALRLAYPKYKVITTSINGVSVQNATDTLKALSRVTISGYISGGDSTILESFNGIVSPKVYDKAKVLQTLGNEGNQPLSYTSQKNILYRGKASVTNGHFSFSFVVPKDISYDFGYGKLSYYASNETEDASGASFDVFIGGSSNLSSIDTEGPQLSVFMNDESFISGGITSETPRLLAFVNDSSGINTVGNGIGHDIVAVLDGDLGNSYILNDNYESDLDSYQSGRIEYTFTALKEGEHTVRLKVWDVSNNSASDSIDFIVAESAAIAIRHLFNYPNPFTQNTAFYFEHNQASTDLDVLIQIYTVSGKLVKTIDASLFSDGFRLGPIDWDGLDDFGNKIGRGVYIYKAKLRNQEGQSIEKLEKLVILK